MDLLRELQLNTLRISSPMSWMDKSTSEMVKEKLINVQGVGHVWSVIFTEVDKRARPHN